MVVSRWEWGWEAKIGRGYIKPQGGRSKIYTQIPRYLVSPCLGNVLFAKGDRSKGLGIEENFLELTPISADVLPVCFTCSHILVTLVAYRGPTIK